MEGQRHLFVSCLSITRRTSTSSPFSRSTSLRAIPVLLDSTNNLHRDIRYHPEQPARIDACVKKLVQFVQEQEEQNGDNLELQLIDFASSPTQFNEQSKNERNEIHQEPFSTEELNHAKSILQEVHSEQYVQNLEMKCHASKQKRIDEGKDPLGFIGNIDDDTFLTTETFDVCLRATAAWIRCVDMVLLETSENDENANDEIQRTTAIPAAMALTRPPGHHATSTLSNGFCLFNFAAAAAIHAATNNRKIAILDWDVHYGQGVADIIQNHPNIRYASMHQVPAFPYDGETFGLTGQYKNILTCPLAADSTWSCGYQQAMEEKVLPFLFGNDDNLNAWDPDLIIVCAGYDALLSDELASCGLTAKDYGRMTKSLQSQISKRMEMGINSGSDGKKDKPIGIMFGLEGGYQLVDGVPGGNLADAVLETLKAFSL